MTSAVYVGALVVYCAARLSGTEALAAQSAQLYRASSHDLVILDLDMPGMSGEATQLELLRRWPDARIMFASGHADPQREHVVRERGARAFLQKPYEIDLLVSTIHHVVSQPAFDDERTDGARWP